MDKGFSPSGVIYDMDGLLLDTEPFYTLVTQQIAQRYGKNFDWSLKSKILGRRALELSLIHISEPTRPERISSGRLWV